MFRATIYTPKVEDHSRLSESWHLRHAQRAVSIDNISFIPCTMDDKHSVSSSSKDAFSTLNGSSSNNGHQQQHHHTNGNTTNGSTTNGNSTANDDVSTATSSTARIGNGSNGTTYTHNSNNRHASTDNLHKNSDDEQENIIPWRAQLRKTNSRLSLVG